MSRLYVNNLLSLNDYLTKAIEMVLSNDDVCKLLYNKNITPLDIDLPDNFDRSELMWDKIYPYKFIPDAVPIETCFLMFDFNEFRLNKRTGSVVNGYLLVDILCHEKLMKVSDGTRTNSLMGHINNTLNGEYIGVGKLMFEGMNQWHRQPRQYIGYTLAFRLTDVNER